MTQPEVMNLVGSVSTTYRGVEQAQEELDTSVTGLLRQMRDPEVRRGLALTLRMLRAAANHDDTEPRGNGDRR
jgi:uncharacterized protein YjgD (DUF1641 family)